MSSKSEDTRKKLLKSAMHSGAYTGIKNSPELRRSSLTGLTLQPKGERKTTTRDGRRKLSEQEKKILALPAKQFITEDSK